MKKWILETKDLTRISNRKNVIDHINIHVPQGSIYGILGRNSSGKTTTLRMIMGLLKPSLGYVKVFGKNIEKSPKQIYSRVGSIIGIPGFYENLTAGENLEILARLRGIHRVDAVQYALTRVGLQEVSNKTVAQYSIEMRQRLGIAMAIMHEPELLILDEPTNGLDSRGVQEIRDLLVNLRDEKGVTIIISSHNLNEIELLADYIGVIHQGRLLEEITLKDIKKRNRKYIEFQVSNQNKTALILENTFKTNDYEIHEDGIVRIYSHFGKQGELNKEFVENDIEVLKILVSEDNLEDYFIKLTGGHKSV